VKTAFAPSAVLLWAWLLLPSIALAQTEGAASAQSSAAPPSLSSPWSTGSKDRQKAANKRHLAIGLAGGAFSAPRWEITDGGLIAPEIVWRVPIQPRHRLEVGVEGRFVRTFDTTHARVGVPFRFVFGMSELLEMDFTLALSYTRLLFELPYFVPRNGFTTRIGWGLGFVLAPSVSIGMTPIGFAFIAGERVESFVAYEPDIWVRFAPF
jgi:hypothetical protein